MDKILPFNETSLCLCCETLKIGNLVAFPTETVYGLGANALNPLAVEKIFEAKKRPKSDPLIVHVAKYEDAFCLTDMTLFQKTCFTILAKKFWPGPLTIIVKCSSQVPNIVTSNSGYVGIRVPNHSVAIQLLLRCGFPLAAPSANLFGHVSPTSAQHVYKDLGNYPDLFILDTNIPCQIGIESTIIKIVDENEVTLLRPGAISSIEIQNSLKENSIDVFVKHKKRELNEKNMSEIESSGQLLTHYSPLLESFILSEFCTEKCNTNADENFLVQSVLIDFNSKYKNIKKKVLCYFNLSTKNSYEEASFNLFSILRKAEAVSGAKYILLPDLSGVKDEMGGAVFDRIYRAASGKFITIYSSFLSQ